jgi:hypothetical protein
MRWIKVRTAKIDPKFREMFEQYGLTTMQLNLALGDYIEHNGKKYLIRDGQRFENGHGTKADPKAVSLFFCSD